MTAENQWLHLKLIADLKKSCKEVFPVVEYAYTTIPTYPSGQIGFLVCSKDENANLRVPLRKLPEEQENQLFKYYNSKIHEAAFVLPNFANQVLNPKE